MRRFIAATAIAASLACAAGTVAQDIDQKTFNVVGTWSFLRNYQTYEKPLFTERLAQVSGGRLKANISPQNELNLKGTELLRLLKQGVFDFAFALPIYVDDGDPIIEALDIAGLARDGQMARKISGLWMPELQKDMREKHNAIVLGTYAWAERTFYCRTDVKSVDDLKGKKIRTQGTSQADLVAALAATSVNIAFADVIPAFEKGLIDCAISGGMQAYQAKWHETAVSLFRLPVGVTVGVLVANLSMWSKLSPEARALLEKEAKDLEARSWDATDTATEDGVACLTGTAPCAGGPPGKLKLNPASETDLGARDRAVRLVVLKNWAKRCGPECAVRWNDLVGTAYGITLNAE